LRYDRTEIEVVMEDLEKTIERKRERKRKKRV